MSERRGTKALETWCRRLTEGYPGVKIENMTTSWRNGLAFCAIIHHFRPDLIDFASLTPSNIYYNNSLAFSIAERQLGIPALLDAEDMVMYEIPDRLSILTYLSQFYQVFGNQPPVASGTKQGPSQRIVPKRPALSADRGIISPSSTSPPTKVRSPSTGSAISRRDPCAKCLLPVFLAERLNVGTKLFHRTCFRCARCQHQLSLANYYETETDEYCCETCPDEEDSPTKKMKKFDSVDNIGHLGDTDSGKLDFRNTAEDMEDHIGQLEYSDSCKLEETTNLEPMCDSLKRNKLDQIKNRSLSDEEKSKGLQQYEEDEYSTNFEQNLEETYQDDSVLSKARTYFLSTHLLNEDPIVPNTFEEVSPQLQQEKTSPVKEEPPQNENTSDQIVPTTFEQVSPQLQQEQTPQNEDIPPPLPESKPPDIFEEETVPTIVNTVNNTTNEENQQNTATLEDITSQKSTTTTKDDNSSSLVKSRMLLFEDSAKNVPLKIEDTDKFKKSQYLSVSSDDKFKTDEDLSYEANYKTVKSDVVINDSVDSYSSVLSDTPLNKNEDLQKNEDLDQSPLEDNSNKQCEFLEDKNNILSKSIVEDLSDQSSVPINASLLEDSKEYPDDLNPFGDEEEEETQEKKQVKPQDNQQQEEEKASTNPFGSSDEDEEQPVVLKQKPPRPPQPAVRTERKVLEAPRVSLNPFWSDDEEPSEEEVHAKPTPLPRSKNLRTPEPIPRSKRLSNNASHYSSNSSISSMGSSLSHTPGRKKKPAPPPPIQSSLTPEGSKQSSPSTSTQPSPKLTPKIRKNRKAPLPPTSTPFVSSNLVGEFNVSPIVNKSDKDESKSEESLILSPVESDIEKEKISKDEKNRNRQSQNLSSPVMSDSDSLSLSISQQGSNSDKSTHGKWKRKKGPAPSRPVPQRRQIRPLPLAELKRELDIIEMQQQGLEKQGVKLEQLIREQCEQPGSNDETALDPETEDLVLELFELVNEKNELFRRQAELMYLRRQQRLEEEHADLEYQIRCLMDRPERNKTDSDKAREEELINRLLEVVERRNEIVECLEMDRVREAEEDQSISYHMSQLALKKDEDQSESPVKLSKKEKKKMKKEKKLKEKGKNLDVDKDIDESEQKSKDRKKKKWF